MARDKAIGEGQGDGKHRLYRCGIMKASFMMPARRRGTMGMLAAATSSPCGCRARRGDACHRLVSRHCFAPLPVSRFIALRIV